MSKQKKQAQPEFDIREFLYEDLMSQIEPDLLKSNRKQTIDMLNTLSPEALKEKMESYAQAFDEFRKRWPKYVEDLEKDLKESSKKFTGKISDKDESIMSSLEKRLSE